jgi:sugar lactone lactonase YvrE
VTLYNVCTGCTRHPAGITTGPDGNLWFTQSAGNRVSKMNMAGTILASYTVTTGASPYGITTGPDGNLWVAECGCDPLNGGATGFVASVTTSGSVTQFNVPGAGTGSPEEITTGPDGNLWFTESGQNGALPALGIIALNGGTPDITDVVVPNGSRPWGITTGPDNSIWFTDNGKSLVGRYVPSTASFTEWADPNANGPQGITSGSDGNLWMAGGSNSSNVARVRLSWPLNLTINGTGFGSVTSAPSGITCPSVTCSNHFIEGTQVVLTPSPQPGSRFAGWNGFPGCSGNGACTVPMTQAQNVTATFNSLVSLSVTESGSGTGTVTGSPAPQGQGQGSQYDPIYCTSNAGTCSDSYDLTAPTATTVTLTETPASSPSTGSRFGGWGGDGASCGTATTCQVSMSQARSVSAVFVQTWALTVLTSGSGSGTVTSSPGSIACPGTCSGSFDSGNIVQLTAAPSATSRFAGWTGGGCSGSALTCNVTMNQIQNITATFTPWAQPDGLIAIGSQAPIGEGVFNTTGAGQTVTAKVLPRATAIFNVTFQNDGKVTDTLQVHGPSGVKGFTVTYFHGTTNVTSAVVGGAYTTGVLAVAGTSTLQIRVKVASTDKKGATFKDLLTVSSIADPTRADAVGAVTTAK